MGPLVLNIQLWGTYKEVNETNKENKHSPSKCDLKDLNVSRLFCFKLCTYIHF